MQIRKDFSFMKNKNITKTRLLYFVLGILLISVFLTTLTIPTIQRGCTKRNKDAVLAAQSRKDIKKMPAFVVGYWPTETDRTDFLCYSTRRDVFTLRRGVGVFIQTDEIVENEIVQKENRVSDDFVDRVNLYIDGSLVSDSTKSVTDNLAEVVIVKDGEKYPTGMSSGYEISWTPFLLPGIHTAKIEIQTKSGKIFEFEWMFQIFLK